MDQPADAERPGLNAEAGSNETASSRADPWPRVWRSQPPPPPALCLGVASAGYRHVPPPGPPTQPLCCHPASSRTNVRASSLFPSKAVERQSQSLNIEPGCIKVVDTFRDARTRCRPVSRGRLSAPVSPARDPVPAALHRRKAAREVRRRILSGRFAHLAPIPPQPAMGPPQGSIWVPGWLHESAGSFVIPVGVARRFGGASHPSLARAENGPSFATNRRKPWQIAYSHLKMAPYLAPRGTNVLGGVS